VVLTRAQLIDLVQNRYFAAIDDKRLEDTLTCLAPDCVWNIYPAGTRLVGRDSQIRAAFEAAFERYPEMWHGNFECIVDVEAQRLCAVFDVRLVDREGRESKLSNAKIFRVEDSRFTHLDLYFSTAETVVEAPR